MWTARLQRTCRAAIGFDSARQAVWLHPLDEPEATGRLCKVHADSLRPPRGWRFFDYREPAEPQPNVTDLLDARSPLLGARSRVPRQPAGQPRGSPASSRPVRPKHSSAVPSRQNGRSRGHGRQLS
jgi:hypothetical protein